jgi:hypothetical protein
MKQKIRKIKLLLLFAMFGILSCQLEEEIISKSNYQKSFEVL